ncbi:hypothetical protein FACS189413_05080 [Bacteroidia bacterium]|nr:hypothetical protein FACS189413_05080 [Bacteroidia bacterium]
MDESKKMVIVNHSIDSINAQWLLKKEAIYLDKCYAIETPVDNVETGIAYSIINDNGDRYALYFTALPLIYLAATDNIVDEPKVPATFTMVESNTHTITSDIGIETRGGYTQGAYAKKSYKIVFREDASQQNNKDVSLLGMRSDDDWDLQAMANEPLRMNEKTSFDIWRKINRLSYQSSEPDAVNGSRMNYAELFLNGEYKGVYCVSEPVDRKQLKLKKYDENKGIRGELYKSNGWGATVFLNCPPYDNNSFSWVNEIGHGYECEYPNEVFPDWKKMYDFVYFVMYGSDADFYARYHTFFNVENLVDYFLLMNVARAWDNAGKNLFVARYNTNEPYFYVPWDYDGTFGTKWDGSKEPATGDIKTNVFYRRLLKDYSGNGFMQKLQEKWKQLRNDWLTISGLMDMFYENYNFLLENGIYEREELIWSEKDNYHFDNQYIDYMENWITERLSYLDETFKNYSALPLIDVQEIHYPCNIHVYNVNGQLIKTMYLTDSESGNLGNNLNRGIYFIHLQNENAVKMHKIIVK